MTKDSEKQRHMLPGYFLPVMVGVAMLVLVAVVTILVFVISESKSSAERNAKSDSAAETASARLNLIPDAVAACGVDRRLVLDGGRKFVGVDDKDGLTSDDLDCLEVKLGLGEGLNIGFPGVQAGDPPRSRSEGGFTWTTYYPKWMGPITYTIELE